MNIIKNVNTYDFREFRKDQYLVFDGSIVETGFMKDYSRLREKYAVPAECITDGQGSLLLPGLSLCHTHIYSTFARGMALPFNPENFLQVLEQLWWKLDSRLDREMVYYSALVSGLGYLRNGVTSVIDHHASGTDILGTLELLRKAIVEDLGLKGMFCFETSDRFDLGSCLEENTNFLKKTKKGEWGGHFGMHASMTLSDDTLREIKKVIGEYPIHIHVAESELDQESSRHRSGLPVIERLDQFGLINRDSLLVHGTYLSDKEMEIIAERGAWIVLNPSSNMNNGVGLPDYRKMKAHDLKILLGNDGMSQAVANEWQHLLVAMHHRYSDPVAFGLDDLGEIIRNGYDYFNSVMGAEIGRIEKGYQADLMLLDYDPPTPLDGANALGHLFYGQSFSFRPRHLWARGEMKLQDFTPLIDEGAIMAKSRELSSQLWESLR